MKDLGVDINEGVQGVDLPRDLHNKTKYNDYDKMLYNLLKDKNTADEFRESLEVIGDRLKQGKGPDGEIWGW